MRTTPGSATMDSASGATMAAATWAALVAPSRLPASCTSTLWPWRVSATASSRPIRPAPRMVMKEGDRRGGCASIVVQVL